MDNKTYSVPLTEFKLPETGFTVRMKKFLTTAQSRELQKLLLKGGSFDAESGKMGNVSPDTFLEMQDVAADMLIKEIVSPDKTNIAPFTQEWLGELPITDGNLVYEKLNEVISASTLTDEAKKK